MESGISSDHIEEPQTLKNKPDDNILGFGRYFTDRMYQRYFKDGNWTRGEIVPFADFSLSPATVVFHYGQAIFDGLRAFRQQNGEVKLFRPDQNAKRMNLSAQRLVMPKIPENEFLQSLKTLVNLEKTWVPTSRGTSLYIRPTMIAVDPYLGVKASEEYLFYIILSPSGTYFANGFQPTKIMVEDEFVRAAKGGTGFAKAAGNYAGSLIAAKKAQKQGFDEVLWLDGIHQKYVEEIGAMNVGFVIDNKLYSPKPSGTILDGITRRSVKQLCQDLGIDFIGNKLSIDTITESISSGNLTEIFGIGTAASIAPVGQIKYQNQNYTVNDGKVGPIAQKLYQQLTGIQYGEIEDRHGWMVPCQ